MKKIVIGIFLFVTSLFGSNAFSQKTYEVDIQLTESVLTVVKSANDILQEFKGSICANVEVLSKKASSINKNCIMEYSNWVQFVKLEQSIEELNDQWNEAPVDQLKKIIAEIHATKSCSNCSNIPDNQVDDLLADENYLNDREGTFNAGLTSSNQEEFDDEKFWTLINCDKKFTVLNNVVVARYAI